MRHVLCAFLTLFMTMQGIHAMEVSSDAKGKCLIEQTEYPAIGFGTYPYQGETCFKAVENAYLAGYRLIDTATFYQNFIPIGKVLQKYGRQNFYVISKVWSDSQKREQLKADFERTLKQLQTNYLDAYLIHWPNHSVPIEETFKAMDELRQKNNFVISVLAMSQCIT